MDELQIIIKRVQQMEQYFDEEYETIWSYVKI